MFEGIFKVILRFSLYALIAFIVVSILYFVIKTIYCKLKNKKSWIKTLEDTYYWKYIDFIKWVLLDLFRGKDYFKMYGLWIFTGYFGQGKTIGMAAYAKKLQREHPHKNIKLYSNIDLVGQEKRITNYKEILDLPKSSIVILDEGHADFTSTTGKNAFPIELLRKITQMRKKELMIFTTSPVYHRMNIMIRENANFIIESSNFLDMDRLFRYKFYRAEDYDLYYEDKDKLKKNALMWTETIIASNDVYGYYNTVEEVDTIMEEEDNKKVNSRDYNMLRNEFHKLVEKEVRSLRNEIKSIKK